MGAGAHGFSAFVDADDLVAAFDATVADISDPLMALEAHPNVFRFEGRRLGQRAAPAAEAAAQSRCPARVGSPYARRPALVGVAHDRRRRRNGGDPRRSEWGELAPFVYLVSLPVGFAVGAIVARAINKRIQGDEAQHVSMPKRPSIPPLTLVPRGVARRATDDAGRRPHPLVEAGLRRGPRADPRSDRD